MNVVPGTYTPYTTVVPLVRQAPTWVPKADQERIASYDVYDQLYWSNPTVFRLSQRGEDQRPIYIPNARTVCDTTAHYYLKNLTISAPDPETNKDLQQVLDDFIKREAFFSKFHSAKLSGVARGDWLFHITADPTRDEGERISINSVHPRKWFPIRDPLEPSRIIGVHLAEEFVDPTNPGKRTVRRLTYRKLLLGTSRRISREEALYDVQDWWDDAKAKKVKQILPVALMDDRITALPVYSLKNIDWQNDLFGSSELRGIERILSAVNQAISDQEMALALDGLGVYATDAGRPVDDSGNETDWEIGPAKVMEVPAGAYFRRVEGIGSVTPSMDHITYLEQKIMSGTGLTDAALGSVDVQVAQSGIALAIRFMPTAAKLEQRDLGGLDVLRQMFHDWLIWWEVFEGQQLAGSPDNPVDLEIAVGDKLPSSNTEKINELNNMLDRKVISRQYYRAEMKKLGYEFPDDMQDQIDQEIEADNERAVKQAQELFNANGGPDAAQNGGGFGNKGGGPPPPNGTKGKGANRSNNKNKSNESGGTEADQTTQRQARGGKPQPNR